MKVKEFSKVKISAQSYYLPARILTSAVMEEQLASLYERLRLPLGRLELMTGIRERRMADAEMLPSQMAIAAAKKLFREQQVDPESIDLLIFASVCRDQLEPATAAAVHATLNLNNHCEFYDVSNACLGVMNAWMMAGELVEQGRIGRALIVAAENGTPLVENTLQYLAENKNLTRQSIKKYLASLTIGSGAYASIVESIPHNRSANDKGLAIKRGSFAADTKSHQLCQGGGSMESGAMMMETDSEALLAAGVALAQKNWQQLGRLDADFEHTITHQVGSAHEHLLLQTLQIEKKKNFITYPVLGNMGSCSLPISLAMAVEQKRLRPHDRIALLGIGSGLSSWMMEGEWLG